jgi:hypothetical protein
MEAVPRQWFQSPWNFREAIIFTVLALLAGFVLQYAVSGAGIVIPEWPFNVMLLALFAAVVFGLGIAFRKNPALSWFGDIPLGLCLILALAALSLIGGIVPQDPSAQQSMLTRLRLNQIFSGWPFAVIIILFLANLGLALVWKLIPFSMKNLQFILFHAGFWIALSCGIFGSSDLQRLVIFIEEGKANHLGYRMDSDTPVSLPFSVFLHDFSLEEYSPQLFLYDPSSDRLIMDRSQAVLDMRKGTSASWKGVDVLVLEYLPSALPGHDGTPLPADRSKGIPFAKVRITIHGKQQETWISTGSPFLRPDDAQLGSLYLVMVPGTPKLFRSAVTLQDNTGRTEMANLQVNKPVGFGGWKLYQMGYDEKNGRWSRLSIIEAIRDPWLPAVYVGFFMLMAGNILFFWNGIKRTEVTS